jgi:hypothetical protein
MAEKVSPAGGNQMLACGAYSISEEIFHNSIHMMINSKSLSTGQRTSVEYIFSFPCGGS